MKLPDILSAYSWTDRTTALAASGFLIATIAFADAAFRPPFSLGFLYLIPILIAALYVSRKGLLLLALICTFLRVVLAPLTWSAEGIALQSALGLTAFFGLGLFVEELARRRRRTLEYLRNLQEQMRLRQEAEEQLRALIETSPAAILTVDEQGKIALANQAAQGLLASDVSLTGETVGTFLPILAGVPHADRAGRILRTTVECKGRRRNGEVFQAHVWFSTYATVLGPRLAAIILDTSEQLRDREELGLTRLMASSRILVRAVSHEIRNLCAAISVMHTNLQRLPGLADNEDFRALGSLAEGLKQLVSTELRPPSEAGVAAVNLHDVLEELRIIIEPALREEETDIVWEVPDALPLVCADRNGLLHVFMNLVNNSRRALQEAPRKRLTISARAQDGRVTVRFIDTGPGVAKPQHLFQPFQQAAEGVGLGLYVSRVLVRSFAGDLRLEPRATGCCFAVVLAPQPVEEAAVS